MDQLAGIEVRAAVKAADVVVQLLLDNNAPQRLELVQAAAECARRAADCARATHEHCPTHVSQMHMLAAEDAALTAERAAAAL